MKAYGGVDVRMHVFLASALVEGQLHSRGKSPSGRQSDTNILGSTGTRTPNPRSSSLWPIAILTVTTADENRTCLSAMGDTHVLSRAGALWPRQASTLSKIPGTDRSSPLVSAAPLSQWSSTVVSEHILGGFAKTSYGVCEVGKGNMS
jgi:hypothetical protein